MHLNYFLINLNIVLIQMMITIVYSSAQYWLFTRMNPNVPIDVTYS